MQTRPEVSVLDIGGQLGESEKAVERARLVGDGAEIFAVAMSAVACMLEELEFRETGKGNGPEYSEGKTPETA